MLLTDVQTRLNRWGFPVGKVDGVLGPHTKQAVKYFQEACNLGPHLAVDGIPGELTQAAIACLPYLSEHFVAGELRSNGNGNCCIRRELLAGLEKLRAELNMPIHIISAYRDPAHNKKVGGAQFSMHVYGLAADIPGLCSYRKVEDLQIFSGIGHRHGAISHVDMRHNAGSNNKTPNATPIRPEVWAY
jgi:peptidoglycan hydrolase-like protein with peptidoglycan-binding domain